jgi:hypothetical protein
VCYVAHLAAVLCAANRGPILGITLREIQPRARIQGEHPWKAEFVLALAREDLGTYSFDPDMPGVDMAHNTLP